MYRWRECILGDVCKVSSSKRIFAKEYVKEGIPFYRGKEIIEKQQLKEISTELFITEERYNEIANKYGVPRKGDLLLTSVGTLGIPYVIGDEKFYFKDGNITWLHNLDGIDSVFLYYWFLSPLGKHNIDTRCIGSTQKALPIDTLLKFPLVIPPITEQKRISHMLQALDKKIAINTKINHHLVAGSETDSSPDINFGSNVSRRATRRTFSFLFTTISKRNGCTMLSNRASALLDGIVIGYCMIWVLSPRGILVPFVPATMYLKNGSPYKTLYKNVDGVPLFGLKHSTSAEQPPLKSQYVIFLKYGRILDINTSPLLNAVVWLIVGRLVASVWPALFGCMFSVEIYVVVVNSATAMRSLLYEQISPSVPFFQSLGISPPYGSKFTNHDLKIACAICSK